MTTRERRRQARALWEKACATMECDATPGRILHRCHRYAALVGGIKEWSKWSYHIGHRSLASALLDGLDVKDLP